MHEKHRPSICPDGGVTEEGGVIERERLPGLAGEPENATAEAAAAAPAAAAADGIAIGADGARETGAFLKKQQ